MIIESLNFSGQLSITLKDKTGNIKDCRNVKNLMVQSGLEHIASRIVNDSSQAQGQPNMSHMALGSGTDEATTDQTDIISILGSRKALDSVTLLEGAPPRIQYEASFSEGVSTGAVTEAGIFNSETSASGIMLCRTVFPVVNKAADDTMSIVWTITLSAV